MELLCLLYIRGSEITGYILKKRKDHSQPRLLAGKPVVADEHTL